MAFVCNRNAVLIRKTERHKKQKRKYYTKEKTKNGLDKWCFLLYHITTT